MDVSPDRGVAGGETGVISDVIAPALEMDLFWGDLMSEIGVEGVSVSSWRGLWELDKL